MPLFSFRMSCDDCGRVGKCKAGKISVIFDLLFGALLQSAASAGMSGISCPNCGSTKLHKVAETEPDREGKPPSYTVE